MLLVDGYAVEIRGSQANKAVNGPLNASVGSRAIASDRGPACHVSTGKVGLERRRAGEECSSLADEPSSGPSTSCCSKFLIPPTAGH